MEEFLRQLLQYEKPFVILLTSSGGTKYEKVWDSVVDAFAENFTRDLAVAGLYGSGRIHPLFAESISHGILAGSLRIAKAKIDLNEKLKILTDFCMIYSNILITAVSTKKALDS